MSKRTTFLIILGAVIISGATIFFANYGPPEYSYINLYFYNPLEKKLRPERRKIPNGAAEEMSRVVLEEFLKGSKKPDSRTIPKEAIVNKSEYSGDGTFEISFTADYKLIHPTDEMIFRSALVWTLTELDFIAQIVINIGSEPLFTISDSPVNAFTRDNIVIKPNVLTSNAIVAQEVTLYYPDYNLKKLVPINKTLQININDRARSVTLEILSGPPAERPELSKPFADDVKFHDATKQGSVCYVNLSREFLTSLSGDPEIEKLQIYSIVNSLTLPNLKALQAKKVQFFIENKRISDYKGGLDLSAELVFDESLIEE